MTGNWRRRACWILRLGGGLLAAWLVFPVPAVRSETPKPALALEGLDPIALADGRRVPGLESLETVHGLFRYRFASAENQRAFAAAPEKRGIQFGGACGKMGPFSGMGNPSRFLVHDRHIYIFASDFCVDAFKKDPEAHIEKANPVPKGTAEQVERGKALIELALRGFGGADKVDRVRTLQELATHTYKARTETTVAPHRVFWAFPDRVRIEEEFKVPYGFAVRGAEAVQIAGEEHWPLESTTRAVAWRQALRFPLAMLRHRGDKGFVAIADGRGHVEDTPVERLTAALDGATSTWSIDPRTGHILQSEYRARLGTVGDHVVQYGDFREVSGITLPHEQRLIFNGKPITMPEVKIDRYIVNGEVKDSLFDPGK